MKRHARLVFFVLAVGTTPVSYAVHWDIVQPHSPARALALPERSFAVGCELRGCCAGCSVTLPIDLRVAVDATVTKSVALHIRNIDPVDLAALEISGNARLEGSTVIVGPGESMVSGFSDAPTRPIPLIFVQPTIDSDKWMAIGKAAGGDRPQFSGREKLNYGDGQGSVEIVQLRGGARVNNFRYRYPTADFVAPSPSGPDQIRLAGNDSGDNAVILTDFHSGEGCECDSLFRTTVSAAIGNARSKCLCNSEIAVFARNNAMSYETDVDTWHRRTGELHTVQLRPFIKAPVNVVVTHSNYMVRAWQDVGQANTLYLQNRVGVQFVANYTDASGTEIGRLIDKKYSCNNFEDLKKNGEYYKKGQLNVYYHERADVAWTCSSPLNYDPNIVFVGTVAEGVGLAHEIGHSYGLLPPQDGGHTDCVAGFGNDNIMWPGGPPTRSRFTLGQVFRLNVRDTSQLNVNRLRQGPNRKCAPLGIDLYCPILTLDAAP